MGELSVPGCDPGELAFWEPAGRPVRTGTWAEQSRSTVDMIEEALAEGRFAAAAALGRHLLVEAQEIHDLYGGWVRAIPHILEREGVAPEEIAPEQERLAAETGARDPEGDWERFRSGADEFAARCEAGVAEPADLHRVVDGWRQAHDAHCDLVAGWLDLVVDRLGEERLGDLWAELQTDGIAAYARYDVRASPWSRSFELLLQGAIEGMHGHLGGPGRRGAVQVIEHDDRVELRFDLCGSGGRIRAGSRFGLVEGRYDWAWNEAGVCRYCVHCCVLMQLEPIKRLGYPARVVDPPLRPGEPCSWTVYRDPSLVPDEAYRRVGQRRPEA